MLSDDSTSMYSSRSSFIGPESGPIPLAKITYDDPPTPKRGSLVRSTLNVPCDEGFGVMKSTYVHTSRDRKYDHLYKTVERIENFIEMIILSNPVFSAGIVRIQKEEWGEVNHSFL